MRHRDCEVFLECDDQALEEHNVHIKDDVVECYVVSEPEKIFKIGCNNHSSRRISASITVDGRQFGRPRSLNRGLNKMLVCRDDAGDIRTVAFSSIAVTDDEDAVGVLPYIADLGLIEVKIVRSTGGRVKPWKPSSTAQAENFGPVHETTKKGGMHCISFGAAVQSAVPRQMYSLYGVMYIDEWSAPYVTFKFYYRPLAILQAQGIVEVPAVEPPMDPANTPLGGRDAPSSVPPPQDSSISLRRKQQDERSHLNPPAKRPRRDGHVSSPFADALIEDLSTNETGDVKPPDVKDEVEDDVDDVEAIEAQMQALRERLDRAKTKRAGGSQPPRFVKRESSPIRVGQFNGGVIDLTND